MSVINNVLKDLKNKSSSFTPLELADVPNNKTQTPLYFKIFLPIVLFLVVVFLLAYFVNQSKARDMQSQNQSITTVELIQPEKELIERINHQKLPVVEKQKTLITKPEITGLQLKETVDYLELRLQLPIGAQSFLKKSSQNRYVFLISNAAKKIITPDIKDNTWLESITVDETVAGLEIQFLTRDKILVETHHNEQGGDYNWVIRLHKSLPVSTTITDVGQVEQAGKPSVVVEIQSLTANQKIVGVNKEKSPVNMVSSPQQQVRLEIKPVLSKQTDAQIFHNARVAMRQKDWLVAQQQLEKLLGSRVDKKARIELLAVLVRQKKSSQINLLLAKSLHKYPAENEFLVADAGQLFLQNNFSTLITRYKQKLNNIKLVNLVAASFQNIGQHDNAITYYQRSLATNPQQPRTWVSLAISQEQKAQFDRAFQSYQMALKSGALNKRLQSFIHDRLQQLSQNTN